MHCWTERDIDKNLQYLSSCGSGCGSGNGSGRGSLTIRENSTVTNIGKETRVGILIIDNTIGTNTNRVLTRSIIRKRVNLLVPYNFSIKNSNISYGRLKLTLALVKLQGTKLPLAVKLVTKL